MLEQTTPTTQRVVASPTESAPTVQERTRVEQVLTEWDAGVRSINMERLGGLTNRIFHVTLTPGPFTDVVVRLPGHGTDAYIDRAAEQHNGLIASARGIGARILHTRAGAQVSAFQAGRVFSPADVRNDASRRSAAGRLLRQVHDGSEPFAGVFDPAAVVAAHRAALGDVPTGTDELIARIGPLAAPPRLVPCHNDPWPENFIDAGDRLFLLDWEYSAMGDPAWDLADLAVEAGLDGDGRAGLLAAHGGAVGDPDLGARMAALCPVTDVLWGLWALVQAKDDNPADDWIPYARHRLDRAVDTLS